MNAPEKAPGRSDHPALVATLLRAMGVRLFRDDDAGAHRHGWQVISRHSGLSRMYRDPRFNLLQACPACLGAGVGQRDRACKGCSGTGRVTLSGKLQAEAGRGR